MKTNIKELKQENKMLRNFYEQKAYFPLNAKDYLKEIKRLKEYQDAYYYMLDSCWELQEYEGKKETNKELNKIFKLNKEEQVKN